MSNHSSFERSGSEDLLVLYHDRWEEEATHKPWDAHGRQVSQDFLEKSTSLKPSLPLIRSSRHWMVVGLICASAGVPALFGALFHASLGLQAKDGIYSKTFFTRPTEQGLFLNFGTNLLNPLLISSVSSTLIGATSPFVLALVAYFLGHLWLKSSGVGTANLSKRPSISPVVTYDDESSKSRPNQLPTPYQHAMIVRTIAVASEWALFKALQYMFLRSPAHKVKRHRAPLTPVFLFATVALFTGKFVKTLKSTYPTVMSFSWSIKLVDILLHDQIESTVMKINSTVPNFPAGFALSTQCLSSNDTAPCPVSFRAGEGYEAANNQSEIFKVYTVADEQLPNLAIAGPPLLNNSMNILADTIGVSTVCKVYRPVCAVQDLAVQQCWNPLADYEADFYVPDVSATDTQVQVALSYLNARGRDRTTTATDGNSYATNVNPTGIVGWSCFPDYTNIVYNDTDTGFTFVNWWMIGQGIANTPRPLCSIFSCNSTTYNLRYLQQNSSISIDPDSMVFADGATTMAVTGALPFSTFLTEQPGTNSGIYNYSSRYLDSQLQVIVNSAGNTVGNDTNVYASNLAQGISNLLVGWGGAGTIEQSRLSYEAIEHRVILATSFPLSTVYTFVGLHLLYALCIILLGLAVFTLPSNYRATDKIIHNKRRKQDMRVAVDDVSSAAQRFGDIAVLMHELLPWTEDASSCERSLLLKIFSKSTADPAQMVGENLRSESFHSNLSSAHSENGRRRKQMAEADYRSYFTPDTTDGSLRLRFYKT